MRFFKKKYSLPASRRRWLADLGVAIQRVAFVASLWSLLLDALSPNTKIFIPPIVIHPLLFLSFTPAPPPPSETARAIESSRDEELEPQPGPSNAAFFVCLERFANPPLFKRSAVAHTITLHVLSTQREPAVNNECGIEESLYTFPIPESPSDEEALRKLAECGRGIEESSEITTTPIHTSPSDDEALRKLAKYGCGIEESSDVTTTPISTSTSDQANIETNDNEHEHDDPPIVQNTKENANTSVINIQDVKNTLGLVLLYALAAAEKMNNPRLHALVKRIRWHHAQRATPEPTTPKSTLDIIATSTQIEVVTESSWHDTHCATPEPTTPESTLDIISTSTQNEEVTESIEEAEKAESEDEKDSTSEKLEEESDGDVEVRVDVEEVKEVSDEEINANTNKSEEVDVNVEEVTATADESKDIQIAAATEYRWDEDTDDSDDEWFTICKGKVIKTSTLSGSSLPPVAAPTSSITEEETDTTTSPSTVVAPAFIESVAEVSTVEPQHAIIQTCSKEKEWHTVRRAEKLPAFPPEPQAPSMSHNRCRIVPAKNPNWLEEKAERNRREMEAWKAFKEAEKEAERVRVEEEERRAREVKKARAAHMANFDTAMGRLDELLKGAREAREKWEKEKEENEKTLKGIDVAQGRIGELVDLEKVRDLVSHERSGVGSCS
ncbi:hypothetical protein C0989_010349 [Termitomyces sp. Mn162]|nr:hypothetical protein C0989_010349 [Termitomyces sp. Mn162]